MTCSSHFCFCCYMHPKRDDIYQTVTDDQPHNPYSEALLLHGHSHSILHITNIDNKRYWVLATISSGIRPSPSPFLLLPPPPPHIS